MNKLLRHFKIDSEKEYYHIVEDNITSGIAFKGTNLWVLIFAIFIASLGLNTNSTAVIIGAMLISPLMGPIMGMGFSIGINDLSLLKKALLNYLLAAFVGLLTSCIYFLISPINEAHSEILARTSPTVYDVLIALFGGFAGILATSTKSKGNVIPGVAIATALMPPLCTAGYGIATWKPTFFIGAIYLFIINTVFIAIATFITIRLLKFPFKHLPDEDDDKKAKRFVWLIAVITLLPSLYFGYDIVQQQKFVATVNKFIREDAVFNNDYLLNQKVDAKQKEVILTYGGRKISDEEIQAAKEKFRSYNISNATLEIKQGFEYLTDNKSNEQITSLGNALEALGKDLKVMQAKTDSMYIKDSLRIAEIKLMKDSLDKLNIPITKKRRRK
ncbi:MAG: DUF389 domain-containing protein [Bacteroidetes bacterium]|nr:DUF389 domain-containing protein [Bacteroidota bacterium]